MYYFQFVGGKRRIFDAGKKDERNDGSVSGFFRVLAGFKEAVHADHHDGTGQQHRNTARLEDKSSISI